jgi:hypothetical protein
MYIGSLPIDIGSNENFYVVVTLVSRYHLYYNLHKGLPYLSLANSQGAVLEHAYDALILEEMLYTGIRNRTDLVQIPIRLCN